MMEKHGESTVAVAPADIFYGPMHWSEKVGHLQLLVESQQSDARRYLERATSIAKFTWEPGDLQVLQPDGGWEPLGEPTQQPYGLIVREQRGALRLLEELGAMDEVAEAVVAHAEEFRPDPPYKPQLLKKRLAVNGWIPEARVPPPSEHLDTLPINDRYDALKFFRTESSEVGVAIEIEGWEINNDLIKFWRGFTRGQISVGVIIQPDPATVRYCFEQMRLLTEPLFGDIPIAFVAPDGPGLTQSTSPSGASPKYTPFRMPAR